MLKRRCAVLPVFFALAGFPTAKADELPIFSVGPALSDSAVRYFPINEPLPTYLSADAAAIAFVDFVRQNFKQQFIEYCGEIIKNADGQYSVKEVVAGSPGGCQTRIMPGDRVAIVHTHPQDGVNNKNLKSVFQVFSAVDVEAAEIGPAKMSIYLGAPAGHVLRYDAGTSVCDSSTVVNPYVIVRPSSKGSRGALPVGPKQKVPFPLGKKPFYCL